MESKIILPRRDEIFIKVPDSVKCVMMLDIDGVLNSTKWFLKNEDRDYGRTQLDPVAIAELNKLVLPGVYWVLSSSWRYSTSAREMTELLQSLGWKGVISDTTPIWTHDRRGITINKWCEDHEWNGPLIIIDDDHDLDPYSGGCIIYTTMAEGFLPSSAERGLQLLQRKGVIQ